jgi:Dolichyl-phosphate-mannose-protein mannosyltransferase
MPSEKLIRRTLWILILLSLAVRAFIAGFIELGNDEVYYWTYAKFPDLSHFDHPPMVGWVIQLFTFNLHFNIEFFIRLGSIVFGTINTFLVFLIGKTIKDSLTGLYAAFLFTASFYCFIIAGTFIMPDTPQVLFWLLSLLFLLKSLPDRSLSKNSRWLLLVSGFTIGLALLSKYHSIFLIAGAFLYILFFNRSWFRVKETYIAFFIAILLFVPVIIWNWQNQFISFTFHESRVDLSESGIRWDFLITELLGQFFYNNPVNCIIIIIAFIGLIKGNKFINKERLWFVLFMSVPLSLVFLSFSLFNSTLPHWTGPAYIAYILIAASFLRERAGKKSLSPLIPWPIRVALLLTIFLILGGLGQIKFGWIPFERWKSDDFSTQLYGWRQLGAKFSLIAQKDTEDGIMPSGSPIITYRWFPAANLDYYVGTPINKKVYALGTLTRIHKYYWIDKERGNLLKGSCVYFLAFSDDFQYPADLYGKLFDTIHTPDTILIYRGKQLIRKVYVYRLYGLKRAIRFNKLTDFTEPAIERVRYWENQIRTNPGWMIQIKEKARKQGRTIDDLIWQEAKWTAEREMME